MSSRRLLLAAAAVLVAGLALAGCGAPAPGAAHKVAADPQDMSLGSPTAKVEVVEYASPSCSHCARFNNEVFPAFKAKYIDTGLVRYTLREFLTPPNEVAAASYLLARCAGKDGYFTVLDGIYRNQEAMFRTGDVRGTLLTVAQSVGLTEAQFNACVSDPAALKALEARVEKHIRVDKVESTPTFVINGKRSTVGEMTLAELDAAIAQAAK